MTVHFTLPELGEHVEAADLIKILVSVGDRIELDQPVLELETDKADFELPSTVSGIVKEIHVREGGKVKVGQLILTVEEAAAGSGPLSTKSGAPAAPEEEAAPAVVREDVRAAAAGGEAAPSRLAAGTNRWSADLAIPCN